jgi:L-iditol 2-dehydrogenase
MTQTRTTVFTGPGALEVREIELPPTGPRQVLVKVKAVALCTWEQRFYKGSAPESYPFRGGHELSGIVAEVGSEALTDVRVGDTVAVSIMTRCGACYYCRRGMDNFCVNDTGGYLEGQPWGPGGLSDYILVEDYQVYKAAPDQDFAELALAEPVACVLRSVTAPPFQMGDTALVQGGGVMGLLHVLLLQEQGVRVAVSEPDEERRDEALRHGADLVLDPFDGGFAARLNDYTKSRGLNAVFFTAGGVPAIKQALPLLAKGGWLSLYGSVHPKEPVDIDPNYVHYNELVFTGTFSHTKRSFRQAVNLISQGQLDLYTFVSERIPFPEVEEGFERALVPDTYRVVMTFE